MLFYDPYSSWHDRFSSSTAEISQSADIIRHFFREYIKIAPDMHHFTRIPWAVSRPCFNPVQKDGRNCGVFLIVVAEIFRERCQTDAFSYTLNIPDVIGIENIIDQREYIRGNLLTGNPCEPSLMYRGISWNRVQCTDEYAISELSVNWRMLRIIRDPLLTTSMERELITVEEKNWVNMSVISSKDNTSIPYGIGNMRNAIIYEKFPDPDELKNVINWIEGSIFKDIDSIEGLNVWFTCYASRSSTFMVERLLLEMFIRRNIARVRLSIVIVDLNGGDLDIRCNEGIYIVQSEDYDQRDCFYTTKSHYESLNQRINLNDSLYCLGNSFPIGFLEIFIYKTGDDCISARKIEQNEGNEKWFDFLLDDNGKFESNRESDYYRLLNFSRERGIFVGFDRINSEVQVVVPRKWLRQQKKKIRGSSFSTSNIDEIARLILPLTSSEIVLRNRYFPIRI
jgi:hypothetical protein